MNMPEKSYIVLYQYSPNGRQDKGEFSACIADGKLFLSKEDACDYIKSKFESLKSAEHEKGCELDEDWAENISDQDMKDMGYFWKDDFSVLSFEYESQYADVLPEPKYSWSVVEVRPDGA